MGGADYNIFRKDRPLQKVGNSLRSYGGAAVFVKSSYKVVRISVPKIFESLETIVIDHHESSSRVYRYVLVYFPPNLLTEYSVGILCNFLTWCCSVSYPCMFCGEFSFN